MKRERGRASASEGSSGRCIVQQGDAAGWRIFPPEAIRSSSHVRFEGGSVNKKVLVGVLIGVLVLAAAGVGYGAYSVAKKGNEQDRRAEVIAQSRVVDDKL